MGRGCGCAGGVLRHGGRARGGARVGSKSRCPLAQRCRSNQHVAAPPLRQPHLAQCRSAHPGGRWLLAAASAVLVFAFVCCGLRLGAGRPARLRGPQSHRALDPYTTRDGIRRSHGAPRSPPQVGVRLPLGVWLLQSRCPGPGSRLAGGDSPCLSWGCWTATPAVEEKPQCGLDTCRSFDPALPTWEGM